MMKTGSPISVKLSFVIAEPAAGAIENPHFFQSHL
jgi:hypothetical protein